MVEKIAKIWRKTKFDPIFGKNVHCGGGTVDDLADYGVKFTKISDFLDAKIQNAKNKVDILAK